jgi:acetylornithine deacetylase
MIPRALSPAVDNAVVALTRELVAIDSTNPQLSPGGPGEAALGETIARRLDAAGFEVDRFDVRPGRPNVVGTLRGSGGGRTLLLCGHMDVVAAPPDAFEPEVREGRLYGRGSVDMKGGLAAAVVAAERLASDPHALAGDVLVAAVVDEEWMSAGAEELVRRYRADVAILPEQSDLDVVVEHGGFAWFEVHSKGVEAAGIEPDAGVDAIALLAPVLQGLVELDRRLETAPRPEYGRPSVHPSTISGGTQFPAYAQACVLGIERCTVAGETVSGARAEIEELLDRAAVLDSRFDAELRLIVGREPVKLNADGPLVRALDRAIENRLGRPPRHVGDMGWSDSGILTEAGIPCAIFGPAGAGNHTAGEYVDLASLVACADILEATARELCAEPA